MNFPIVFRFTDAKTQDLLLAVSQKLGKSPIETIQSVICMHSAAPSGSWCGGQRQLSAANGSPV